MCARAGQSGSEVSRGSTRSASDTHGAGGGAWVGVGRCAHFGDGVGGGTRGVAVPCLDLRHELVGELRGVDAQPLADQACL